MIDFLLQDGVMETLLGFVTQMNSGPRPSAVNAEPNESLILSYK